MLPVTPNTQALRRGGEREEERRAGYLMLGEGREEMGISLIGNSSGGRGKGDEGDGGGWEGEREGRGCKLACSG